MAIPASRILEECGSRLIEPGAVRAAREPAGAWLFRPVAASVEQETRRVLAFATRRGHLAPRFRGWGSLDRLLPTSDVSCRTARTAAPAPADWQLRTLGTRTIAGPRRLPSYREIPPTPSCPDVFGPKSRALAFDRSSVETPRTRSPSLPSSRASVPRVATSVRLCARLSPCARDAYRPTSASHHF